MVAVIGDLYGMFGFVLVANFIPQLLSVRRSRSGAADVSILTRSVWSKSAAMALVCANFVRHDHGYNLMSIWNLIGCYFIMGSIVFNGVFISWPKE